jgi:chemotaxis-related protein WspD
VNTRINDLLDRDLQDASIDEATKHFAEKQLDDARGTDSVVIFRIGAEWLALTSSVFDEVADLGLIHSVPHRSTGGLLGLTNVRGELLVCVSLRAILGITLDADAYSGNHHTAHARLVVIHRQADRFVFPADDVHGTHTFHSGELRAVPATVAKATTNYTKAILLWKEKTVGLLDDQLLFYTLNRSLA